MYLNIWFDVFLFTVFMGCDLPLVTSANSKFLSEIIIFKTNLSGRHIKGNRNGRTILVFFCEITGGVQFKHFLQVLVGRCGCHFCKFSWRYSHSNHAGSGPTYPLCHFWSQRGARPDDASLQWCAYIAQCWFVQPCHFRARVTYTFTFSR